MTGKQAVSLPERYYCFKKLIRFLIAFQIFDKNYTLQDSNFYIHCPEYIAAEKGSLG